MHFGTMITRNTGKRTGVCGMTKHTGVWRVLLIALVALILGAGAPGAWAEDDDDEEIPFDEAHLFFELNDTDGDLGIHALIDGDAWKKLEIEDPNERRMLNVRVTGRLKKQGLTEFFFESAEPTFDELAPADFFKRFPEGTYEIEGETLDGEELESEVELSHVMPAPADGITLSGMAINLDDVDCDDPSTIPSVAGPVTIAWDAVTMSHPNADGGGAAVQPPVPVTIHNYQVVVEVEDSELSVILPPDVTSMTIPPEFLDLGDEFKYEILAREENFNQTAVESCFTKQ